MRRLDLQSAAGQTLAVDVPTHWGEVPLRTFLALQGKTPPEQFALLCGLTLEQYFTLAPSAVEAMAAVLAFTTEEPPADPDMQHPQDLGSETVGQMELAKKAVMDTQAAGELAALPYLYAIYMLPERIDFLHAFVHGFPEGVAEEVRCLPVTEVLGPSVFFWARYLR